jgi:hypothetical protein
VAKAGIGAEVIAAYSPGSRLLRQAALSLMLDRQPSLKSLLNHRTSDANVYPRSLLDIQAPAGDESHPAEHVVGDALVRFGDGRIGYLTEELAAGFTMLEVDEPDAPPAEPLAADPPQGPGALLGLPLRRLRVSLVAEQNGAGKPGLGRGRYLLRPDRYVMAHRDREGIDDVLTAVAALAHVPAISSETTT